MRPKIIAEIANSHQGDYGKLCQLVEKASEAEADAIKFQWFKYDQLATPDHDFYQDYKKLFIAENKWHEILKLAEKLNLEIWVDVFDKWGLELLKKYKNKIYGVKLHSTILQSEILVDQIVKLDKPLLLGIGGWYEEEIEAIIEKIKTHNNNIILMHGYQGYPTSLNDMNLVRIKELKSKYDLEVGFADHIDGSEDLSTEIPVYAYFAGAKVIEKHLILDRSNEGYDYYSSLEPKEFHQMAKKIQLAEKIYGKIKISEQERDYLKASLKTVANSKIKQGTIISNENIDFKRTSKNKALTIEEFKSMMPLIAKEELNENTVITNENIEKAKITIAVICRLKSTRLPKKALLDINGVPSVKRVLLNCLEVDNANVVLATSNLEEDDPLEQFTMEGRVDIVRGDPDNVARRLLEVAKKNNSNIVLRVTGDCPAVSPKAIEYLINDHFKNAADFTRSKNNSAIGISADVITVRALEYLLKKHDNLNYTEYLSFYFENNPDHFKVNMVELPVKYQKPGWRLTLDEDKDLKMFDSLYKGLNAGERAVCFDEICNYLNEHPEIIEINKDVSLKWKDKNSLVEKLNKVTRFDENKKSD